MLPFQEVRREEKAQEAQEVTGYPERRIVVGYSGGVTSAWCLDWALRTFPRREVVALFHDTKREHPDTYRYLHEMADKLGVQITERSDGRSVEEVEDDEHALANNRMAFCSRILKAEPRDRYFEELRSAGVKKVVLILAFSAKEEQRIQRTTMRAAAAGYAVRFPMVEEGVSKQDTADWSQRLGVPLPAMYAWSDHANCVGCRRGGKAYWLEVARNEPAVYLAMARREVEFGHTFLKDTSLIDLHKNGLKRKVRRRESIDIGACECGT